MVPLTCVQIHRHNYNPWKKISCITVICMMAYRCQKKTKGRLHGHQPKQLRLNRMRYTSWKEERQRTMNITKEKKESYIIFCFSPFDAPSLSGIFLFTIETNMEYIVAFWIVNSTYTNRSGSYEVMEKCVVEGSSYLSLHHMMLLFGLCVCGITATASSTVGVYMHTINISSTYTWMVLLCVFPSHFFVAASQRYNLLVTFITIRQGIKFCDIFSNLLVLYMEIH